ncbi:hypothetical protein DER46DRAFT_79231 [Fusarium sp. MPI-SDFR-AT-0072]|nr:hypothetical protein DER46DRAFT_79231 [Fusarium sp. MPI-SDFR-AT-0072]
MPSLPHIERISWRSIRCRICHRPVDSHRIEGGRSYSIFVCVESNVEFSIQSNRPHYPLNCRKVPCPTSPLSHDRYIINHSRQNRHTNFPKLSMSSRYIPGEALTSQKDWRRRMYNELFEAFHKESQSRQKFQTGDEFTSMAQHKLVLRGKKPNCVACQGHRVGQPRSRASRKPLAPVSNNKKRPQLKKKKH